MRADRVRAGFTLVEMLVALAVFGFAVVALLHLAGENTRTAVALETRTLAGIVAENRAVEVVLEDEAALRAADAGTETLGDRAWRWRRTVEDTADGAILRVDVVVLAPDGQAVAERTVFRERG
ncbi:type II secretion system minor pseudopilin GspI [Coralloluteibacterium stylophorae]|uniref:Type II secretion system protein I n=1 Tax=Coralloluteibacterium stylophorae TaxID=1776034 RepID=A0A8J8AYM2_9GAMM|nr:type II secretion system minor pseudopilin GspI [Coralloluteibacterium stylophorae]MBS7458926.1 type II secretion system minor pseudopilin GspI [Coralloluteibacterium stylophorae]